MSQEHRELRCTNPACTYDMRDDRDTVLAIVDYLVGLSADVDDGKVRHVSVSVHRADCRECGGLGFVSDNRVEPTMNRIPCQACCRHNWYRMVNSPPDVCLVCGAEEDRG